MKSFVILHFKMTNGMDKNDVMKKLSALITDKLHIDLRKNPIHIKLEDDAIVMEGMVANIAHKKKALLLAMGMAGTSGVIDRLKVKPAKEMTDKEIYNHLMDALREEPAIDPSAITIEVSSGVVDIEGKTPSLTHKRLCGVLAWWVPGTTDVINSLEVEPPEEDSPDEIRDALRIVLEKDRLVDSTAISIATKDWVVRLTGMVGSAGEKQAAESDAWYIWGVNDVINELKVAAG